jgi:glutathione S-transferase
VARHARMRLISVPPSVSRLDDRRSPTGVTFEVNPSCPIVNNWRERGSPLSGAVREKAMRLRIYGDSISGNCLKVKWTADFIGLSYDWIETSVLTGDTRTAAFLTLNPAGQVPTVVFADGRALAQSNAIILHLAEGSPLIPADSYQRAKMLEWLFWEQYSHEPYVAVARFQVKYLGKPAASLEAKLVERGQAALQRLEDALAVGDFLVGGMVSLADVALVAYTRWADEGGFDLGAFPAVRGWIGRVETALTITEPSPQ